VTAPLQRWSLIVIGKADCRVSGLEIHCGTHYSKHKFNNPETIRNLFKINDLDGIFLAVFGKS